MYYRFLAIFSHCFSGLCRVAVCFAHSSGFPSKPMICTMSSFSNSSSMAPSNPVPDCRPIMATAKRIQNLFTRLRPKSVYWNSTVRESSGTTTANVRRPSISAIQPMVNCLAGGTGLRIPLAMYRSASNPGKCITRQALVQGVGKR